MIDTAALAAQHNCMLHTHLGETRDEDDYCLHHYGCRPLDYLEEVGWMNERVWLAHGIHFDDAEIARLGEHTEGSAGCLGRRDIGRIEVGRQADLACFTLDELRFSGSDDPVAALVLCGAHQADRVMVGGNGVSPTAHRSAWIWRGCATSTAKRL
jgi:cytosine/adenosine deaminase-related metal-dependent hydrolase